MPKHFEPEDLALFQDLGQLCISPRGTIACVVRSVDMPNDGYLSSIWTFAPDGAQARRFTQGTSDNAPRWSPDGATLAFTSARSGAPQVHFIAAAGGEAHVVGALPEGAGRAQWLPDGSGLLVSAALGIDPESREAMRPAQSPPAVDAPQLAWRLPFKSDGIGYLLHRAFRLFSLDAASGRHREIVGGAFDVLSSDVSPDGRRIAYVRTRDVPHAHCTDLWTCGIDGANAKRATHEHASVMGPKWSPDGRWLLFTGAREEGDAQSRLFLVEPATGKISPLGNDDLEVASPESVQWSADSRSVLLVIASRACQHIVRVSVPDGAVTPVVTGERHIAEMALGPGLIAYFSESAASPRELYACDLDGRNERQLSFLNAWWWERTPMEATIRRFEVPDGAGGTETIEGWLVRAKGASGPQPLLVEAHGGPNSFALLGFPWNTYWNTLCSRGWAVVVPHAVGSTSFGREFARRLNGHWGELDFPQYMAVVDALQADGTTDARVAIAGKSYGGYMSAWAIGHTDRFKAAIVAAPVANLESHYGTSDGGFYSQPYTLSGERHIDPDRYRALSPVNYVHQCTTPTLLLQGKEDERCPRGQSEELFAVIAHCGAAPVEMVMYPGGDHHLYETGKPSHRLDVVKRMTDWLTRWVT